MTYTQRNRNLLNWKMVVSDLIKHFSKLKLRKNGTHIFLFPGESVSYLLLFQQSYNLTEITDFLRFCSLA